MSKPQEDSLALGNSMSAGGGDAIDLDRYCDLFLRILAGNWAEGNRFTAPGTDSLGGVQIWRCASM